MWITISWILSALAAAFIAAACAGVIVVSVQTWSMWRFICGTAFGPQEQEPVSILKPLCGIDDELEQNLTSYAMLSYKNYEVLLGVPSTADPAYALATRMAQRYPNIFRVILEEPFEGGNPKVRQLITLTRYAKNDILLVSDSNTLAPPNYLFDVADCLSCPSVGCITHPIVGSGETNFAALMENIQVISNTAGVVALYLYTGRSVLVGKSIGIRKGVLAELGGFESLADFLAEDFIMGEKLTELKKTVGVSSVPVFSVSKERNLDTAFARQLRWSTMQWHFLTHPEFVGQGLLHVIPLAMIGGLLAPKYYLYVIGCTFLKLMLEYLAMRKVRHAPLTLVTLTAILLKDVILFAAWACAPFHDSVNWRGKTIHIERQSKIKRAPKMAH
eukprot:TRINITY_DN5627_c0_g3_i1.p1 TRINITY_DN5627_c0_g3~~TRINITY_DN5627_c0_g3_i1.p1  ORF type:complete len:398 (+),score=48.20 TRINITY_DN5627_c0_g3_i1:31-1194(+)